MDENLNLLDLTKECAEKYGDAVAFIQGEEKVTFSGFLDKVLTRTAEIKEMKDVSCVGILGAVSVNWIVDMFSAASAGKRVVLLDGTQSKEKIVKSIEKTGVDLVLPTNPGFPLAHNEHEPGEEIEEGGNVLFYTSGTTSENKAVVLTQYALVKCQWEGQQMLPCGPGDMVLDLLPLSHVFGFICCMLWPFANGAATALTRGMRSFAEDPSYYKPTIISIVPALLDYLVAQNALNPELRCILIGGAAPIHMDVLDAVRAKGIALSYGYGLTETASGVAISTDTDNLFALRLCPDTKIDIAPDGEILLSTKTMMKGYFRNPGATSKKLVNGVLHTGDIGFYDKDGLLHLNGRKDDVLVLPSGEKIFTSEWEKKLSGMLQTEVAILEEKGTVVAVIVSDKTEEEIWTLINLFNKTLPINQKISKIRLRTEALPRTATGKVQKWLLKQ